MPLLDMHMLYKTTEPEHLERRDKPEDFAPAEYRQSVLKDGVGDDGALAFRVTVFQGYWDEASKEPKHNRPVIDAHYDSRAEAEHAYRDQLESLVGQGYIYSFIHPGPLPYESGRRRYRILKSGEYE
jgi:hypothetical protein